MNSPGNLIKRNYHWFFAALAVALVVARYMPAVCLSEINADDAPVPLLFHDLIELGHSPHDWAGCGHSDLFPDTFLGLLLNLILRNGLPAIHAAYSVILAAYIAMLTVLYRKSGGRSPGTFAAILLFFFVLSLINFGIHYGLDFDHSLAPGYHTSPAIVALGCLALCQQTALKGYSKSFWWLPVLCFITALSDDIFLVLFTAPIFAALVITRLLYPERLRMFVPLAGSILVASAAGHFLAPVLSPFPIDSTMYTHFHAASAVMAGRRFLALCSPSAGGDFVVFVALDLLFVLFAAGVLVFTFRKPAEKRIPLSLFMLLMFCACLIECDWGASILTGNFTGLLAARHVRLAILLPLFVLLGCVNHLIPWSRTGGKAAISALSLAVCACALFMAPSPDQCYLETQQLIPIFRAEMQKEHIQAGLADYWSATPITLFSGNTLQIRAVTGDGSLLHWLNTTVWYSGDGATNPPPKFGLVYMKDLDADEVTRHYGIPDQVIQCPTGNSIWLYLGNKNITYNPIFEMLSNGNPNELRVDGDMLPSITGRIEGHSRVARAGRDRPGFITHGPYPYPRLAAGRYRITIRYTYLVAPAPGRLAGYKATYFANSKPGTLAEGDLPFIDASPQEFTREIAIPGGQRGLFEMLTRYNGSGDIGIDSLTITYLGK